MKFLKFAVCFACLAILFFPVSAFATPPSSTVALDSWVYPALDKLAGLGLVDDALQGTRPYTRFEAARQAIGARGKIDDANAPPVAFDLLRRLEKEFDDELTEMAGERPSSIRFHLVRRGESLVAADGTTYLPYSLTNVDDHPGSFELKAAVNSSPALVYADADGDGLPDTSSPIERTGKLTPGEDFSFVVSLPQSPANASPPKIATLSAAAIRDSGRILRITPLRRARLAWVYRDGEDALFANVPIRQFPLKTNNFGIDYGENHNAQVILESEARLGRYFLLQARPLFLQREGEGESVRLLEGKAALGLGPLELSAGRQSLWWGPGRHGSLLLSNNARPLDMVRLTNPSPATLPWIFRHLGPFRFDLFVSRLEDERVVSEPYFGGLRVNFQPAPWLELGAARTVIFGGDGRPDVGFDDFLTIVGGENLSGEEDNSNSVASLDARVRIPPLAGAEIYAEVGGEDEADALGFIPFISQIGVVGGLYLPRIEPSGRLDLRLEYADTTRQRNSSPVWYRHGIYQSGYTYEGKILGHRAGGDARAYSAELRAFLPRDVTLTLALDLQKRGESQPVREEHLIPSVVAQWQACPGVLLHARYARDEVDNFNFVEGDDRTLHFAVAGVDFAF